MSRFVLYWNKRLHVSLFPVVRGKKYSLREHMQSRYAVKHPPRRSLIPALEVIQVLEREGETAGLSERKPKLITSHPKNKF